MSRANSMPNPCVIKYPSSGLRVKIDRINIEKKSLYLL